jgi:hypothetical protein
MKESLTEQDCKLITEKLLGEEWEDDPVVGYSGTDYSCNRSFKDPQDFFDCFEKLVELGEWEKFIEWMVAKEPNLLPINTTNELQDYCSWLLSRTESGYFRLCQLTAAWLGEK